MSLVESTKPVRALVVDDSALFRRLITRLLEEDGTIEVVDTAVDSYDAREKIKHLEPDVITLDVEMDGMDGITFLRNLMRLHPMPVVMMSSLTAAGAEVTMQALSIGAVDFVTKPVVNCSQELGEQGELIRAKVVAASRARPQTYDSGERSTPRHAIPSDVRYCNSQVIAIGASTGGTEAIRELLGALPPQSPPVIMTQHIPGNFSASFAKRLDDSCSLTVREAEEGELLLPGHAYLAPASRHLTVFSTRDQIRCRVLDTERVNRHRPSVDVMLHSVAEALADRAVGVLLTGMGADGAAGLLAMRNCGAHTICQDEATSVVWGMPGAAVKMNAASSVMPLPQIGAEVLSHLQVL